MGGGRSDGRMWDPCFTPIATHIRMMSVLGMFVHARWRRENIRRAASPPHKDKANIG